MKPELGKKRDEIICSMDSFDERKIRKYRRQLELLAQLS